MWQPNPPKAPADKPLLCRAHDLLWLVPGTVPLSENPLPTWVGQHWHTGLPLVVRRDISDKGWIAVGIRGKTRAERAAAWVLPESIARIVTPESLVDDIATLKSSPFSGMKPVLALLALAKMGLPWEWGVTGSCAYALATGISVMHDESDLDVLIRCPVASSPTVFSELMQTLKSLPCRTDIQIETPHGAFSLKEWWRSSSENSGRRILLKTNYGPVLTDNPWQADILAERDIP